MNVKVIAEIGSTHEGSVGLAKCFIRSAADCGVDAVKFQTHIFGAESLLDAPNPPYFRNESRKDYFERTSFCKEQYLELKRYAEEECGVDFISSPFSIEAVELLEEVGINTYKIPSGEVTNIPLLERVAGTKKKILLSSGMSSWEELDQAISVLKSQGSEDIVLLQCTSIYPCPPKLSGVNLLEKMKKRYSLPVGFSDHTLGVSIPIYAVASGATVIEKHFTLSKKMYGSDAKNSTEPEEFKMLVDSIRSVEEAISSDHDKNTVSPEILEMKTVFEKSVVSAVDIKKSTILNESMLTMKKPGTGIPPSKLNLLLGKVVLRDIPMDSIIKLEDVG